MSSKPEEAHICEEPPPDYETVISLPDYVPLPAHYDPPTVEGISADGTPSYNAVSSGSVTPSLPKLAFADFLPQCLSPGNVNNRTIPTFGDFRSVVVVLNDWLRSNPHYRVIRVESIERKVDPKKSCVETETTVTHEPAYGNVQYVRGLRAWLVPNSHNLPPQQLWYMNVVPKFSLMAHGMMVMPSYGGVYITRSSMNYMPEFESIDKMLEKLNKKMADEPLPGSIISVESIDVKYLDIRDPAKFDADAGFYMETQGHSKLYLTTLRVFFVTGPTTHQEIGIQDFAPALTHQTTALGKPRFEDFSHVAARAGQWLYNQRGIRMTNMQTVQCRGKTNIFSGAVDLNTKKTDYIGGDLESMFVSVLRVAYVKETPKDAIQLYCRAFVPVRCDRTRCETTSETVQRINAWLHLTGARVVGADTVQMEFDPDSMREVNPENTRQIIHGHRGHHWLSYIRLYLDGPVNEPPPELLPPAPVYQRRQQQSAGCYIL